MYNKRPSYTGDTRNSESSNHHLNSHDSENDSTQGEPSRRYPYNRGKGYKNTEKPKTERKAARTEEYDDNPALDFTPENIPRPNRDQKFPPIITIDGRVDTDLDHLMEIERDESEKASRQTWRTYPKPHIFSVIEGSLDDDIDSIANHDGTMEHKLADPLKSFISKDGNLKKVSAKDGQRRTPGTLNTLPPNRPSLGRSMSPPLSRDIIPSDRSSNKQPSTYQSEDEDDVVSRKTSVNCRDTCDPGGDSGNSVTYVSAREVQSGVKSGQSLQRIPEAKGSKIARRKNAWASKAIKEHVFGDESPFSSEIQPKQCSSTLPADDSCANMLSLSSKQLSTQMDELLSPDETQMALWPKKHESEIETDSSSFSQRIDSVRLSTFTEGTNATEMTEEAFVSTAIESVQRTLSPSITEDASLARKNEMINSIKKLLNTESLTESVMSKPPLKVNKPILMKKPKVLKRRRSISPLTLKNKPKLNLETDRDPKVVSVSTSEKVKIQQKPYGCSCRSVDSQICDICEIFAEYRDSIGGPDRFDLRNTTVTEEDGQTTITAGQSEIVQKAKVARQLTTVSYGKYKPDVPIAALPTKNVADHDEASHSVSGACQTSSVVITMKASKQDFKASKHDVSFASTCQVSELRTYPMVTNPEVKKSACTQSPSVLNENDLAKLTEKDLINRLEAVSRDPQSSNIRSSLRAAISVAEHSMSAAAKVAQALFLVIEATRASENMTRSSSESRSKARGRSCSRSPCSSPSSSTIHDDDIIASKRKLEKAMRFLDNEYPELINGFRDKLRDRKRSNERSRTPSPMRRLSRIRSPQKRDDYLYPLQVIERRLRQNASPLMYKTQKVSERPERFYYVSPQRETIRSEYMRSSMDSLLSTEVSDKQRRVMRRRQMLRDDDPVSEPVWHSRPWSPQRYIKCPRRHECHSLSEGGRGACPSTSFDELSISDDTLVEKVPLKSSVRREKGRRESDGKRERRPDHRDELNPREREKHRESKYPRGTIDHRFDVSPKKKNQPSREKHVLKSPHRSPVTKSGHYTQRSGSYIRQQKYRSSKSRGESKHASEHSSSRYSSPHKHQDNSLSSIEDRRETRFSPAKEYKEHRHSSAERRSKPQRSSMKRDTQFVKFKPTVSQRSAAEDERSVSPIRSVMNYVSRKLNNISSSLNDDDEEFNDNAKVDALLVKYDCSPVGNVNCSHHCSYVREDRAYIDKIKRVSLHSRTFQDSWTNTSPRKCLCGRGDLLFNEQMNNDEDSTQSTWSNNGREQTPSVPETICYQNANHLQQNQTKDNLVSTPDINKEQYRETNNQNEVNESESKTSLPVKQPMLHKSKNASRDWEPSYKCGFNDSEMDTWSCTPRKSAVAKSFSDSNSESTTSVDSSGVYF